MNCLYITHRVPWPPDKGDRIRNWHVLRQLAGIANVKLATLADELVPTETIEVLNSVCSSVAIETTSRWRKAANATFSALRGHSLSEGIFHSDRLRSTIHSWHRAEPFEVAVVSASSLVPYLRDPRLKTVPAFVDVVDVDSQKWLDFADVVPFPKNWLYRFEGNRIRRVEYGLPNWANAITLVSDSETALFNRIAGRSCAITATNGVDLEYFASRPGEAIHRGAPKIAFVGAMDYLPNIDAVTWFVANVWRALRQEHPNIEFRVVGRNPTPKLLDLVKDGITVTGTVPDVRDCLRDVSIVIAPMRLGRGLQNKVLEALAVSKAVIASPTACAALKAKPGRDLLQAETSQDWIAALSELLSDPARCRQLGANGRRYVEEYHDWEVCLKPLIDRVLAATTVEVTA